MDEHLPQTEHPGTDIEKALAKAKVEIVEDLAARGCRLERKLGQGGFAEVFLYFDQAHQRKVAVKFLRADLSGKELVRFVREINNLHKLQNQGQSEYLAQVYGLVRERLNHQERFGMIMEYVDGCDLSSVIKPKEGEGRLSVRKVRKYARQIVRALMYLHENDIIHRDLKPSNIMIVRKGDSGEEDQVKIIDFGLSRDIGNQTRNTQSGDAFGTPAYMAPEQAQDAKKADRRSDIWSVGVILYEMLCGKHPFDVTRTMQGLEVLMAVRDGAVRSTPRQENHSVDVQLSRVVMKALEKDPRRRYQTARQFYDDLRREKGTVSISEKLRESGSLVRQWMRGHRLAAFVIGLVMVAAFTVFWTGKPSDNGQREPEKRKSEESVKKLSAQVQDAIREAQKIRWNAAVTELECKAGYFSRALEALETLSQRDSGFRRQKDEVKAQLEFAQALILLPKINDPGLYQSKKETIQNIDQALETVFQKISENEELLHLVAYYGYATLEENILKEMDQLAGKIQKSPDNISKSNYRAEWSLWANERKLYLGKAILHWESCKFANAYYGVTQFASLGNLYLRHGILLNAISSGKYSAEMRGSFEKAVSSYNQSIFVLEEGVKAGQKVPGKRDILFNKAFALEHIGCTLYRYGIPEDEVLGYLDAAQQTQVQVLLDCAHGKEQTHQDYWKNLERFKLHVETMAPKNTAAVRKSLEYITETVAKVLEINPLDSEAERMSRKY